MFAQDFFDYTFMVVREPLERLKSEYRYSRMLGRADAILPFGVWTKLMLGFAARAPSMRSNHYRPQSEFYCFAAEVFRFEDGIHKILNTLSQRLGLPAALSVPHERGSNHIAIDTPAHTIRKVQQFYATDYEKFGYETEVRLGGEEMAS
jgi:hypothetical protein